MANDEVENELLRRYYNATIEAKTLAEANRNLALYEKQVANCAANGVDVPQEWAASQIDYLRALKTLRFQGTEARHVHEAITHLDKAIATWDFDPTHWLLRAQLHKSLNNKEAALRDVNYLLAHFADNKEVYIEARTLQDEIESAKDKRCFVATAVYGTPNAVEVQILRDFRDEVLLESPFGRACVSLYYRLSPPIARVLQRTDTGRRVVRALLIAPIVRAVQRDWPKLTDKEASL